MEQNTEIPVSSVFIEDSSDGFTADQRIFWSGVRSRSIFARCLACFDKTPDAAYERHRGRGDGVGVRETKARGINLPL